jgi:dTDP-4-dehydrorhamnose reductase
MPAGGREQDRPLLLLGAGGQLGHQIRRAAAARGLALTGLTHAELDITEQAAVAAAVERGYALVINAAAYTAVDKAESEPAAAMAVNRDGAGFVAGACRTAETPLIHVSTDYVFDGLKGAPYCENDPVNPLNVYGRSKAAGEQAVRAAGGIHAILRTSWVFGAAGANFVKTMLRLGGEREALSIVADQFGCPTPAAALAERILSVADRLTAETAGTFHCAGAERTSWFDFARAIFAGRQALTGRRGPKLHAIATADYPTPARRPVDSALDSGLFQATFGGVPIDWRAGLEDVLRALLVPHNQGES